MTLKAPVDTRNSVGESVVTYPSDTATVYAEVLPLTAREVYLATQLVGEATHKVTIRTRSGVTHRYRVVYGSRTFEVVGVMEQPRLGLMVLTTKEITR